MVVVIKTEDRRAKKYSSSASLSKGDKYEVQYRRDDEDIVVHIGDRRRSAG